MSARQRIMIVDDSEPTRAILRDYLEEAGHEVVAEAESREQALEAYRRCRPDAVTLDLSLVGGGGLEVLKDLIAADADARVFIVSANAQKAVEKAVLSSGAAAFIPKPIDPEALLGALAAKAPR